MSYSGDAAEQVVRMSLDGVEVAARISGKGAKAIAIMLYDILRDQTRTKGKTRLVNLLRSGKELKVFAVNDRDLVQFCKEAKRYGVLYCVLKDKDATDGITDIMVRAEDASKVNRIFDRFELSTAPMASVRSEIEREKSAPERQAESEPLTPQKSKEDVFLDALLSAVPQEQNPTPARTDGSSPSVPLSGQDTVAVTETSVLAIDAPSLRPSVRQALKEIQAELKEKTAKPVTPEKPLEHNAPKVKKKKDKMKER